MCSSSTWANSSRWTASSTRRTSTSSIIQFSGARLRTAKRFRWTWWAMFKNRSRLSNGSESRSSPKTRHTPYLLPYLVCTYRAISYHIWYVHTALSLTISGMYLPRYLLQSDVYLVCVIFWTSSGIFHALTLFVSPCPAWHFTVFSFDPFPVQACIVIYTILQYHGVHLIFYHILSVPSLIKFGIFTVLHHLFSVSGSHVYNPIGYRLQN